MERIELLPIHSDFRFNNVLSPVRESISCVHQTLRMQGRPLSINQRTSRFARWEMFSIRLILFEYLRINQYNIMRMKRIQIEALESKAVVEASDGGDICLTYPKALQQRQLRQPFHLGYCLL